MPYRVLMIGNNKGGVGKTLITKTISEYAAIVRGLRVLMIDLDPQTNLSQRYLEMEVIQDGSNDYAPPRFPDYDYEAEKAYAEEHDVEVWDGYSDSADIWLSPFTQPYPLRDVHENLSIIPAHAAKLQRIEYVEVDKIFMKVIQHLREFLYKTGLEEDYDLVVIDLRPSKGPLVQAALYAASHLLIPSEMESPSVEGLQGMLSARKRINLQRPAEDPLELVGILPNKVQEHTTLHQKFMDMLRNDEAISPYLTPHHISSWTGYREAMVPGAKSIFHLPKSNKHRKQMSEAYGPIIDTVMEERR